MRPAPCVTRWSLVVLTIIMGLSGSVAARAASGETVPSGNATLTITQDNAHNDVIGSWTLIQPDQTQRAGAAPSKTLTDLAPGSYILIAEQPNGMRSSIRLYRDGKQISDAPRPQINFKLADGETLTVSIHYTPSKMGTISVQSDPQGMSFTVRGPNSFVDSGTTPASYLEMPIGDYNVTFDALEGCKTPPVLSDVLENNKRISFSVQIECKTADAMRKRDALVGNGYVTVKMDGQDVVFSDVIKDAWFATYVFRAAQWNILAGYKNAEGRFTGVFGPSNNVTIAELAKIAHKLGSIPEEPFRDRNPENARALGFWFSPFIASAEARGWTVFQDLTIDPMRPATRAEVVATFLQALDVATVWPKGTHFLDVSARMPYAGAIETAAKDKVIAGEPQGGSGSVIFRPLDPINRAEVAKLVNTTLEVYRKVSSLTEE